MNRRAVLDWTRLAGHTAWIVTGGGSNSAKMSSS